MTIEQQDLQDNVCEFMDLYVLLKEKIRRMDLHLFARWKAGGFIVDENILSMYPHIGQVVEQLTEETEDADASMF